MSKVAFRREAEKACRKKDEFEMKEEMDKLKKMERLKMENCEIKEYMRKESLKSVRETFRMRVMMIDWVKGNYKNRYRQQGLICEGCWEEEVETQSHLTVCEAYQDLREGRDMESDSDLVGFFREVLARRNMLG